MKVNNVFGKPIYQKANFECPYFSMSGKRKTDEDKFDECTCPIVNTFLKNNNFISIIKCAEKHTDCSVFKKQNNKDIVLIEKYIKKYSDNGWLLISEKHWDILVNKKISLDNESYLGDLFRFFGYYRNDDDKVDGILYTNMKIKIGGND